MKPVDVAIVGAGPAGMAAAIAIAESGGRPWLIDEGAAAGGQIYGLGPVTAQRDEKHSDDRERGQRLRDRLIGHSDRISILSNACVWGVFPHRRLAISVGSGWQMLDTRQLILATGAYEYVPPFPGWTMPGVMSPGAAQSLVKAMGVSPGHRVVVAGSGPFLLVVALQLSSAGVDVAAVVESTRRRTAWRYCCGLLIQPQLFLRGIHYLRKLRRAAIPVYWGHTVIRACGQQEVRSVEIAPCDLQGRGDRTNSIAIEADTLAIGYGFVPRTDLAQLCGCKMIYDERLGGWVPVVDEHLRTTVDGVSVAGDGGGIGGSLSAEYEGTLAGLDAACQLGLLDENSFQTKARPLMRRLARVRRFAHALHCIYNLRPGASDLTDDDTIVCRCEELTRQQVEAAVAHGGTTFPTLKVITRLGMGPCQGRMCWPAVAHLLSAQVGESLEAIGPRSIRPPICPLRVSDLAQEATACTATPSKETKSLLG